VFAPPYDVISPAYQEELYARDPRNVVRVVLNQTPGDAGYQEAGETYRRWLAEGVLGADPKPALFLLEQAFTLGGRHLRRYGLLARFRAEDPDRRVVLPHEHTRSAAKEDRYRLLEATRANFSPIFMMFPDRGAFALGVASAVEAAPELAYEDDAGVRHRLWRVAAPSAIEGFVRSLAGVSAYIADGHHRYAAALRYRDEVDPDGAWTLGYFTPIEAPGLVVLPYHRLLAKGPSLAEAREALAGRFTLEDVGTPARAAQLAGESRAAYVFGLAEPGGGALVAEADVEAVADLLPPEAPPSLRVLDTFFVHRVVLPHLLSLGEEAVRYVHSLGEAEQALAEADCRLALVLRGTPVRQILAVAEAGESMPAKSTFFHPKLPSGLVIHPLLA
jgi:uncharacterized protein (DUF1015 family)